MNTRIPHLLNSSMNYKKIYDCLIEKYKNKERVCGTYYENHHIIPKSFYKKYSGWLDGNPDDTENIVSLPVREHYFAHLLLWKSEKNKKAKHKMAKAVYCMSGMMNKSTKKRKTIKISSKLYEIYKAEADNKRDNYTVEERKIYGRNMKGSANPMFNKCHDKQTKEKIGKKSLDRNAIASIQTEESYVKRRKTFKKKYGGNSPFSSEETHKKSRNTSLDRYGKEFYMQTDEAKRRMKEHYSKAENILKISGGWFITPMGKFPSALHAAKAIKMDSGTLRGWCVNNKRIATKMARAKCGKEKDNKTFEELGFSFEQV